MSHQHLSELPPQSRCRLGVARADITPPADIYHRMWGAASHDRAEGVHRPLTATVLALAPLAQSSHAEQQAGQPAPAASPQNLLVLIALDHCLLFRREMEAVEETVAAQGGVPRECLLFSFSHTHAAGLMSSDRESLPGGDRIAPYLQEMAEKIAATVRSALANQQPVSLVFGPGQCALAAHRDLWDADSQQFVCGYHPSGFADDTVLVARATADDGSVLATLVNYACHPTTLAWDNRLISPDFPGAMRETVETATGGTCVFLQGASGDLGPKVGFVGDPAVADQNGRQLGYAALSAIAALPPAGMRFNYTGPVISGATIGTWAYQPCSSTDRQLAETWRVRDWQLTLPCREDLPTVEEVQSQRRDLVEQQSAAVAQGNTALAADCRALIERADRMLTRLAVLDGGRQFNFRMRLFRFGSAFLLAVPGEPYQQLQTELRRRCQLPLLVLGIAGGWGPSYLPPRELYGAGIYQESIALLAPGALETVIEAAAEAIAIASN